MAVSLGLSNFAAAIAIGVSGVDARTRLRVGLAFGLFEAAMPLLGLLLGHGLAHALGHAARCIGAALLIGTGLYAPTQAFGHDRDDDADTASQGLGKLLISALALSIDNLAVGFALRSGSGRYAAVTFANARDGWLYGAQVLWAIHNGGAPLAPRSTAARRAAAVPNAGRGPDPCLDRPLAYEAALVRPGTP